MHPIDAVVRHPVKVTVGALLVALFGTVALLRMPMQLTPEVEIPTITVETRWPGASPFEVEKEIINDQEEFLQSVEGLTKMTSEARDSVGEITLEFLIGTNMDEALLKVNSRLQQVADYPDDADQPVISTSSSADRPIAWFILSARQAPREEVAAVQQQLQEANAILAAKLGTVVRAQNPGLAVLRLRQIVDEGDALRALLTLDGHVDLPDELLVDEFLARYPGAAGQLDSILSAADPEQAAQQLLDQYDRVRELMPPDIYVPGERKFAEDIIKPQFERVPGVSISNVIGGQEPELQVIVDPRRLAARQLTVTDVRDALQRQNRDISGGDFWEGKRRWVVRTLGQYRSPEDVESQILAIRDSIPVYVRDVAEVRLGVKKPDGFVRRFGTTNIAVNVLRDSGANVLDVMEGLRSTNEQLNDGILRDRGLQLTQVYDETDYIYSALRLVNQNIVIGGLLTICVLLLFLRSGRSTLVIGIAIPTSIIGTFLILHSLGRSLNVISLAGLAFAVGMLVDNAVVVLENIYRHYQSGQRPFEAAVKGTKEVWGAIVASTLTTLAVFIPVIFVQEEAGQLFRDIALAISSAVGLSMLVSITLIPTFSARLFRREEERRAGSVSTNHQPRRRRRFSPRAVLAWVDRSARRFVEGVVGVNRWIQGRLWRRLAVVGSIITIAAMLSYLMWPNVEYLPTGNRNLVFGIIMPPPGYNLEELMEMGQMVEDDLRPYWDMDPDDPRRRELDYPAIGDFFYVARNRQVFVGLRAMDSTRAAELIPLVMELRSRLPGSIIVANQSSLFARGLAAGRTIDVEITGDDLPELVQLGGRIMGELPQVQWRSWEPNDPEQRAALPQMQARPLPSLDLSSPEIHVRRRPVEARDMDIYNDDLGYTINALVDGAYATDYFLGSDKIDLSIIGNEQYVRRTQDLENLPIATPTGQLLPLAAVAEVTLSSGPEQVNHRERRRAITIQVTPPADVPLEDAINRLEAQVLTPLREGGEIPPGYLIALSGTADKLRDTWLALRWVLLLAVLVTYLLMAALFESWLHPLVVIFAVPVGAVGGILGLMFLNFYMWMMTALFGWPPQAPQALDILTMLGFVILVGTVVNNAILIVHQSLNHIREEMEPREAILESVRIRVRPIFMTTATTVFGLAPLVFFPGAGSELYRGLGSVVLGGLLVSSIFTLVLIPTLFSLMWDLVHSVRSRLFPEPPPHRTLTWDEPPVASPTPR